LRKAGKRDIAKHTQLILERSLTAKAKVRGSIPLGCAIKIRDFRDGPSFCETSWKHGRSTDLKSKLLRPLTLWRSAILKLDPPCSERTSLPVIPAKSVNFNASFEEPCQTDLHSIAVRQMAAIWRKPDGVQICVSGNSSPILVIRHPVGSQLMGWTAPARYSADFAGARGVDRWR